MNDYGLILYIRNFKGILVIGSDQGAPVRIVNIVGYINDHTVYVNPKWHPKTLTDDDKSA